MTQGAAPNFSFIEPMKALPVRELPVGNWVYELKFDGYRALAFKAGKEVRLVSRNQVNFGNDYPQLIDALKLLTAKNVIIDGEIAALDQNGKTRSNSCNRTEAVSNPPRLLCVRPAQPRGNRFALSTAYRTTQAVSKGPEESSRQYLQCLLIITTLSTR